MLRRSFLSRSANVAAAIGAPLWCSSSSAAEEGLSAHHLTIGSSLALTGPLGGAGVDHSAGVKAAFGQINKAGGIHGRELRLLAKDDAYVPARTLENVRQMLDRNAAFFLMSCMGTANTAAVVPMVEQMGAPLVGPITGATSVRQASLRNVFHIRASYADETVRVVQELVSIGLKDIAVVYLDNPFGKEVLKDAERTLAANQLRAVGGYALAVDGSNATAVVSQVLDAKPGAVLLGTTGTATTSLLLALRGRAQGLPVAGLSVSVISSEIPKLGKAIQGLALAQVFPDADKEKLAVVRAYQAGMRAIGVDTFGGSSFEGWINAQFVAEGLRRAGREVTRDRLRAAFAGIKRMDLGGYVLGVGASAPYVASKYVDLAIMGEAGRRVS